MTFGKELRFCPRRIPGRGAAAASLALGVLFGGLTVLVALDGGFEAASGRTMMIVLTSVFFAVGGLLLWRRQRRIGERAAIRVMEQGVVEESVGRRRVMPFDDVARLLAQTVVYQNSGNRHHTLVLVSRTGDALRIASMESDNVDEELIALIEQKSGRVAEALS